MLRKFSFYFNNLALAQKLTILLLVIFVGGITFSGIALANILNYKAQNEITSNALLLLRTLNSVRYYTNNEVTPHLQASLGNEEFSPQTVPAYSSRKVFDALRKDNNSYQDFLYKEAMLKPTNPQDMADSFETEIIQNFRQNKNMQQVSGFRSFQEEKYFYVARPLAINDASCLRCHSTPEVAPKEMIKIYGDQNGIGWKLNEVLGFKLFLYQRMKFCKTLVNL
ncbi:Tll0287-like domain-containing protein [Scytonema sp. PRP1]|uniref:Tll0287-like domain-containing protein n=1 Tax=Scytonema sp. PRP1 TaxID=3120513 RepID=UPI00300C0071